MKAAKLAKSAKKLLSEKAFEILSKKLGKRITKKLLRKVGNEALPGFAKLDLNILGKFLTNLWV